MLRTKGLFKQSINEQPLISVITVVFNGKKYLEQTIQSIINTSYENLEYIIIDGGSNDGTLEIIKKYEGQIDYWVSEPDLGIYDAMNKGTIASLGSYTLHINADDLIFDYRALEKIISENKLYHKDSLNLFGSILFFRIEKRELVKRVPKYPDKELAMNIINIPGGHQAFLGKRNKISLFDISYKLIAERVMISKKNQLERIDISTNILAICRSGGASYGINFQLSSEIKRAVSEAKSIRVFFYLVRKDIYLNLLQIAKRYKLVEIKRRLLG